MAGSCFYAVADDRYFLGAVALLNSLRLCGHNEPFVVVDAGLEPDQRSLLSGHAHIVDGEERLPGMLVKWAGPRSWPAETMVILDADVIVIRSLGELVEEGAGGAAVAFLDDQPDRHHPDWGALLGVGTIPPRPYVNSGLLVLPAALAELVLPLVEQTQRGLDLKRSRRMDGSRDDPFYLPDQDVWNAALAACSPGNRLRALERRLAPFAPYEGLGLRDPVTLDVGYDDGVRPFLLHQVGPKPWHRRLRPNVYSRLLGRLLVEADLEIRVDARRIPYWLRNGVRARADAIAARLR